MTNTSLAPCAATLPIANAVVFPLYAVNDDGTCGCNRSACDKAGKHPIPMAWQAIEGPTEQPTTPGCGLKTGQAPRGSGVIVVDADDAAARARVVELNGGAEPDTYTVATGRGAHYYFQCPDFPVRRSVKELHPKIDILGEHSFVVAPGSPHRTGKVYTVIRDVPIAPCPAWLREWPGLRSRASTTQHYPGDVQGEELLYNAAQFANYLQRAAPCVEGQGGDRQLFDVVQVGAYDFALPTETVLDVMAEHYDARCVPPWGDQLAERVQHKAHDAKTSSTRPAKRPGISLTLAKQLGRWGHVHEDIVIPPREPANDTQAQPPAGRLGFAYGGWSAEPPPVDFLVDGLLPRAAVAMFYGRADSLKTWLLFSMATALAEGRPFLGTYKTKPTKVGIVDFETGRMNVHRRLYMLRAAETPNLGAVSFSKLKPNDPEFWAALAPEGFDVVFVDSLRKANPGADENDSAQAILPLELAAEFAEATGCAVVFIHHAKKASSDGWPEFRGSAAIEDQVDCAYAVRKVDVSATRKTVEIRCEKPGDMRTPDPFAAEVEFDDVAKIAKVTLSNDEAVKQAKATQTKTLQTEIKKLLANVTPTKALDVRTIRARLSEHDRGVIDAALVDMVDAGSVTRLTQRGAVRYFLDSDRQRDERVFEVIDRGAVTTLAQVAKHAHVDDQHVRGMVAAGRVLLVAGRLSAPSGQR